MPSFLRPKGSNLPGYIPKQSSRNPVRSKNQNSINRAVTWNQHPASDVPDNNYHKTQKNTKMKKITIILALVLTVSTSFAFNGPETVNNQTLTTFNSEFAGVTDASWTVSKDFYKVTFTMNQQTLSAYYNKAG